MMNKYIYILLFAVMTVLIVECDYRMGGGNASQSVYRVKVAYPLCDALIGEDSGGDWTIVSVPTGSTLTNADLVGDCPSIDFDLFGCGTYVLRYTVESSTCDDCFDSEDVTIEKCCLNGSADCN